MGRWAFRRRLSLLMTWLTVLAVLGGVAVIGGGDFDESFDLPGTESQVALDFLGRTFPQAGGTTAQVVVVVPEVEYVRDPAFRTTIEQATEDYERVDQIDEAVSPLDEFARGVIFDDNGAAIISLRFDAEFRNITEATFDALGELTAEL